MSILKTILEKFNKHSSIHNWVPVEQYEELLKEYKILQDKYNTLAEEINEVKSTISYLNREKEKFLHRIDLMKGNFKYLLKEKDKVLAENRMLLKSTSSSGRLNKYLWALLFISICINFYQASL